MVTAHNLIQILTGLAKDIPISALKSNSILIRLMPPKIPNSKYFGQFLIISHMLFISLDISEGKWNSLCHE